MRNILIIVIVLPWLALTAMLGLTVKLIELISGEEI